MEFKKDKTIKLAKNFNKAYISIFEFITELDYFK